MLMRFWNRNGKTIIQHELTQEKLQRHFGHSWKRLPDEIYKRLSFQPATFLVEEHHVAVYAGMDNETMLRADRPCDLLRNSIATPSLVATILNGKYINSLPPELFMDCGLAAR